MNTQVAPLAEVLALAFAHGPLAGAETSLTAARDGAWFEVSVCWHLLEGTVAIDAHGTTPEACYERIAAMILRLWPELEEVASWV